MLETIDADIIGLMVNCNKFLTDEGIKPLMYEKWESKFLKSEFERLNIRYPLEVKLPPSNEKMLEGDFTPSRVIKIDEPIRDEHGNPIWFANSSKEVYLRMGYLNGDSRYPCDAKLCDTPVHGLEGGDTGSGKSVAMNSMLFTLMKEYAPWEVKLVLADFKNVEFPRYGRGDGMMPHISNVIATKDIDYIVSVLEDLLIEMETRNTYFGLVRKPGAENGVQNIADFRKFTGLTLPRIVIVVDEFQTMFLKAGRKIDKITLLLEQFVRLGRSTGVHLFFASQSMKNTLSGDLLGNFGLRIALKCNKAETSSSLIGNEEAIRFKKPGSCIINTASGDIAENKTYRIPYQSSECFTATQKDLVRLGEQFEFNYNLDFYSENDVPILNTLSSTICEYPTTNSRLYIGQPARVYKSFPQLEYFEFIGDYRESIAMLSKDNKMLVRMMSALMSNFVNNEKAKHTIFFGDRRLRELSNVNGLLKNVTVHSISSSQDEYLRQKIVQSVLRKLMIEMDTIVFTKDLPVSEEVKTLFNDLVKSNKIGSSELWLRRYNALKYIESLRTYAKYIIDYGNMENVACLVYAGLRSIGCDTVRISENKLSLEYIWILGCDKISGFGRNSRSDFITDMCLVLNDGPVVNNRYILAASTYENYTDVLKSMRFRLAVNGSERDMNRLGIDVPKDFPETLAFALDDLESDNLIKFKLTRMDINDKLLKVG